MEERIRTGGKWEPTDGGFVQFLAGASPDHDVVNHLVKDGNANFLIAINNLTSKGELESFYQYLNGNFRIMIDSGCFNYAARHAALHGIGLVEAFESRPETIEGWDELYRMYIDILYPVRNRVWGYVELDFGAIEDRKRIRHELRKHDLSPMPVYKLTDPLEYYRELLKTHSRICAGGFTVVGPTHRRDIFLKMWEIKQEMGSDTWIHLLGVTWTAKLLLFCDFESIDSSSWLRCARFGAQKSLRTLDYVLTDAVELVGAGREELRPGLTSSHAGRIRGTDMAIHDDRACANFARQMKELLGEVVIPKR